MGTRTHDAWMPELKPSKTVCWGGGGLQWVPPAPELTLFAMDLLSVAEPTYHIARYLPSLKNSNFPFHFLWQVICHFPLLLPLSVHFLLADVDPRLTISSSPSTSTFFWHVLSHFSFDLMHPAQKASCTWLPRQLPCGNNGGVWFTKVANVR